MNGHMKPAMFLLMFLLAQASATPQGQQPPPTSTIEGSVVKVGTTEAVPKARVTLSVAQGNGAPQGVTADSEGRFAFRNVAAGQYRLTAARDAYVTSSYGQRGPNGSGTTITVSPQQPLKDLQIAMTPTGAIAGRVVNRDGEPVGNANVQALRYSYQEGRRSLVTVQTATTNDLGEYRLFWMAPGQYIVSAQPAQPFPIDAGGTMFIQSARGAGPAGASGGQAGGGSARIMITGAAAALPLDAGPGGPALVAPPPPPPGGPADIPDVTYLPVYYPGTTDSAAATAIDLRAGGTITGVNMTAVDVHPVSIRGMVMNAGRPAAGAQVSIYQGTNTNGNLTIRTATASDTGAFEFRNVAPGSYELTATLNGSSTGIFVTGLATVARGGIPSTAGRPPAQPLMAARAHVDVLSSAIDNVVMILEAGPSVSGKVTIDGRPASDLESSLTNMRVQLQSEPSNPLLSVPPANPESNGTFALTGIVPGNYRLSVSGLPRNTYVKSAMFNGVDAMNGGLRIEADPRGALDIVLGSTPGSLDVTALDDKQMPFSGVTVVLVPDAPQQKRYDIYRNATSDASGKIHWDGLVPGDYKAYAWEDVENFAWTDPDFMRIYEGRGSSVRIDNSGRATAIARVIPFKAN